MKNKRGSSSGHSKFVRIVAIICAILMAGSVLSVIGVSLAQ
ncbi:MAG: hypothetical protein Q4B14_01530 [Clostridia bacterium]|nr:hypothetical protein [Clostridia bacterium]